MKQQAKALPALLLVAALLAGSHPSIAQQTEMVTINECIEGSMSRPLRFDEDSGVWGWEIKVENTCDVPLEVLIEVVTVGSLANRKVGWLGSTHTLRKGRWTTWNGRWEQKAAARRGLTSRPPRAVTYWCVYNPSRSASKSMGWDRCYGANSFSRSKVNWNPILSN